MAICSGCSVLTFREGNTMCFQSWLWGISDTLLKRKRSTPKGRKVEWGGFVTEELACLIKLGAAGASDPNSKCACLIHSYKNPKLESHWQHGGLCWQNWTGSVHWFWRCLNMDGGGWGQHLTWLLHPWWIPAVWKWERVEVCEETKQYMFMKTGSAHEWYKLF